MILTIARLEFRRLLLSPLAWSLFAVTQLLLAWIYLRVLEHFSGLQAAERITGLTQELSLNLYSFAAVIALFVIPLLSTRLLSEEFRLGTYELLGSAPITAGQVVAGKYLGLLGALGGLLLIPLLMCLGLLPGATIDLGLLMAASLGLALVMALFAAVGLFLSSLTDQPMLAGIGTYGVLFFISIAGQAGGGLPGVTNLFEWISWNEHYLPFLLGVIQSGDLAYYLLMSGFFLLLAVRRLDNRRLTG